MVRLRYTPSLPPSIFFDICLFQRVEYCLVVFFNYFFKLNTSVFCPRGIVVRTDNADIILHETGHVVGHLIHQRQRLRRPVFKVVDEQ